MIILYHRILLAISKRGRDLDETEVWILQRLRWVTLLVPHANFSFITGTVDSPCCQLSFLVSLVCVSGSGYLPPQICTIIFTAILYRDAIFLLSGRDLLCFSTFYISILLSFFLILFNFVCVGWQRRIVAATTLLYRFIVHSVVVQ